MQNFLLFLLTNMLSFGDIGTDPTQEAWQGARHAQQFECERLDQAEAHRRYPGDIPPKSARFQALYGVDALVCDRRIKRLSKVAPRDAAILETLTDDMEELTALAAANADPDTKWVVDAFYPNPVITRKVNTASRTALAERGYTVSRRVPRYRADDVTLYRQMQMRDAIPLSCRRLWQQGALDEDEAFLALALLHEKENELHAGVCRRGEFKWVR